MTEEHWRQYTDNDIEAIKTVKGTDKTFMEVFQEKECKYDPKARYYDAGGIETLEVVKAKLTPEQYEGFLLGNAIVYNCRFNFKYDDIADKIREVEKSINMMEFLKADLMERLEEEYLEKDTERFTD